MIDGREMFWARWGRGALCAATVFTLSSVCHASTGTPDAVAFECNGPHDLIVAGGRITLIGFHAYEHVCVQDGGILYSPSTLTLRAATIYVAPYSAITTDGVNGYEHDTHDCISNYVMPNGAPGGAVTVVARQAIIQGRVSANGGYGLDNGISCAGASSIGNGGDAGRVLVEAQDLQVVGRIEAVGGAGGAAAGAPGVPAAHAPSGHGGKGGRVTLIVTHPGFSTLHAKTMASGGKAGTRGDGPKGADGATGVVEIRRLTSVEQKVIPPSPPSLITTVAAPPAHFLADPRFIATRHMTCQAGDLRVPPDGVMTLGGLHRYRHVCIERNGLLDVQGNLTLVAQTILVAPGGHIAADGASPDSEESHTNGRYQETGACQPTHAVPHAGVTGATTPNLMVNKDNDGYYMEPQTALPGGGGSQVTLVARAILIAGILSGDGGAGQDGAFSPDDPNQIYYTQGGGGGSGGGLRLVAHDLQLTGFISVVGGAGGNGAKGSEEAGPHGGPGCIKIFADALHTAPGPLPVAGPAIVDRRLLTDPVPPSITRDTQYTPNMRRKTSRLYDHWQLYHTAGSMS